MLDIFLFTVNSIMPVVLIMAVGYLLKISGFFTADFLKQANRTVFYVCLPTLLFKNIADIEDISELRFDVIGYAMGAIVIIFIIGLIMASTISDPNQKGVVHQAVFRSNFALIGVPLAELMGGANGIRTAAVLSLFTIPTFNILSVIVLSIYKGNGVKLDIKKIVINVCKNPLIIGIVLGIIFSLIRMAFGQSLFASAMSQITFATTAVNYVAKSATPLALLVLGGQFDFKKVSGMKRPLVMGLIGRNIMAPIIGVGGAAALCLSGLCNFGPDVFAALIALFATPIAVASAVMAEAMDNDGQLASQLVVWATLFSILSLFITIFLVRALGLL